MRPTRIKREGDQVQGLRTASATKLIARLTSKGFSPEVTLDLRGQPPASFRDAIAGFVSVHHRRGVQQLSILFDRAAGEGDADSVLDAVVAGLTLGAAAPLVRAFASARGNDTALSVLLI